MIRVIAKGTPPRDRMYHGTCSNCGCLLECTRGDARESTDQRESGLWIKCPTNGCGWEIGLTEGATNERDPR